MECAVKKEFLEVSWELNNYFGYIITFALLCMKYLM